MKAMQRVALLAGVLVLGGCDLYMDDVVRGSGPLYTEERSTARFYGVSNATSARVEVIQAPYERVRITAQDNLLRHLRTRVENGTLRIYTDPGVRLEPTDLFVVEVDMRTLEWLQNSGSGEMSAPIVDAYRLEVNSSGSGRVRITDLLADSLVVFSSGSGDVHADGDVLAQRVRVSGSGDYDASDLLSRRTEAQLSGSGDAVVRARDRLDVTISGSGSLRYYGTPSVWSSLTGSGRLIRAGSY